MSAADGVGPSVDPSVEPSVDPSDDAADGSTPGDAADGSAPDGTIVGAAGMAVIGSQGGPTLTAVLESLLLVTDEPTSTAVLAQVVERPVADVEEALTGMARSLLTGDRGIELRQVAGGWRFYTRSDCAPWVERYVLDGQQARLTQAALETLAVIAYRQPVTRQRVSAVRGVNVDGVVRTLVARGLVVEAGPDPDTGAVRYRTTSYLLERLGLSSLDQLPSLAPLLPEIDDLASDSSST